MSPAESQDDSWLTADVRQALMTGKASLLVGPSYGWESAERQEPREPDDREQALAKIPWKQVFSESPRTAGHAGGGQVSTPAPSESSGDTHVVPYYGMRNLLAVAAIGSVIYGALNWSLIPVLLGGAVLGWFAFGDN